KFPHHECEIAQNVGAHNHSPVKYWLHGNMLTLNGKRMSKSTGNTLLPDELFSGNNELLNKAYSPMVVRFFMMQAHYGSTLDFSSEALEGAERGFIRLMSSITKFSELPVTNESSIDVKALVNKFYEAMGDDFNTPILISHLFEASKFINSVFDSKASITQSDLDLLQEKMFAFVFDVMGLALDGQNNQSGSLDHCVNMLIEIRHKAKFEKNYELADHIRDELAKGGIQLKDGKDGTSFSLN